MQETTLIEQDQPVGAILSPLPAPAPTMTLCSYGTKLTREELARVATPAATATHKPIPHIAVVEKLIEALGFRQIGSDARLRQSRKSGGSSGNEHNGADVHGGSPPLRAQCKKQGTVFPLW